MDPKALFRSEWTSAEQEEARKLAGPILVVGASGFIGSKLFFDLLGLRDDVYAVAPRTENSWRLVQAPMPLPGRHLKSADVTDSGAMQALIAKLKPRTVFNLSAYGAYARQSSAHRIHSVNYLGTLNLIRALMETGCDAFVQAGSSSEYGTNCSGPPESGELRPNSDYAVSKGAAALMIRYYGETQSFPCVNLRLYSIYGPWEERDRLIPTLLTQALQGKFPPFADPRISRDFVYVDDCLRAFIRAALTVCKNEPGLSVNIASGIRTSLADVATVAKKLFKIEGEPRFGSMANRKWDLSEWYGDPRLAREKMGWAHRIDFEQGLQLSSEWEKSAADLIRFALVPRVNKKISVIVACYRDHDAVPVMHERLTQMFQKEGLDYEIIFVNDRSPTGDEDAIRALCLKDSHVVGISHSRNFGSQSAFVSGMEVSTGDAVVLMDGDLQDPPEVIPDFVKKWQEGAEVVFGVRVKRKAVFHMQILYKVFYRIFRALADISIPVDAGDFSLIDRKAVTHLLSLSEKDLFLRGLRAWIGFRQIGVPYTRPERMFGSTTNNFMKNIWWAKKAIFSFSVKPLEYIQRLGFLMFVASFLAAVFYFVHYLFSPPKDARGITTIIILTLALGGIELFAMSVLGDYLGKILEEVKNRPRFIRARILKGSRVIETHQGIEGYIADCRELRGRG